MTDPVAVNGSAETDLEVSRYLLDRGISQYDTLMERVQRQGVTLSGWMILGNAAALAFSVRVMIDGSGCFAAPALFSATAFACALIFLFAGLFVGFLTTLRMGLLISDMNTAMQGIWIANQYLFHLASKGIPVFAGDELAEADHQGQQVMEDVMRKTKRLTRVGLTASIILSTLGTGFFSVGLVSPFVGGHLSNCVVVKSR